MIIREAQVAGRFYPADRMGIEEMFELFKQSESSKINYNLSENQILGAILPHAGHVYSGYQTLHFFEILKKSGQIFDTWVIIHPLHYGGGVPYAVEDSDYWNTPLGKVRVDMDFINAMDVKRNRDIHRKEHSSEVILPFIQKYCNYDFSFVSIGVVSQNPENAKEISLKLIKAIHLTGKKVCLIASSDFSHYVRPDIGKELDQRILNPILKMDTEGIYNAVIHNELTVCGFGPIMVLCDVINRIHPGSTANVLSRGNSGEVFPSESVVDYISVIFTNDKLT